MREAQNLGEPVEDCTQGLPKNSLATSGFINHANHPRWRVAARTCILLGCCALVGWVQAFASKTPDSEPFVDPTAGSTYVGADTCKGCHSEIYEKHFANTPHAALLKEGLHGCEDCHGPGSAHVAGGGDITKIIVFSKLSPAQASARCMRCHQSNEENSSFAQSMHLSQGVGCLSCHSPHNAASPQFLLIKQQPLLCYGCHQQQRAEFARPYRHRVDVGLIKCTDCHNPHGSFRDHQLRESAGGAEVCTKCHSDKMGPFVFEHMPVKQDGCTACHVPHGSTNPRLLRVSNVNVMCLQCHTADINKPTPEAPSFHRQNTQFQACTLCHTQIHGSNFSEFFFR
jgi:DmsE family decaheme c-type cytochrome